MIPYSRQNIDQSDIDAVVDVLYADFLTQGPKILEFEQAIASRCKAQHAVAVNSATSGLHVACLALGLGPGDLLWTVPNTFVASANCALHCGAEVDFVDIDPRTWNMSISTLRKKLVIAKQQRRLPKVIVPVHFAGQPTKQEAIWELAQEFGFRVIEDASHSIGATRQGEPVGSCRWSDITIFSFHPVKLLTTAEGGMALTNNEEYAWRMSNLRSHGITRDPSYYRRKPDGQWYYEQIELGFNYRMNDLQAALGLSQLDRLDAFIERRNLLARRYHKLLANLPLKRPTILPENRSTFHIYVVRVDTSASGHTHREIFEELRRMGVGVNLHYMPVYLQPYYRDLGFNPGLCPESERYSNEAITLPLFYDLSESEHDEIVASIRSLLK